MVRDGTEHLVVKLPVRWWVGPAAHDPFHLKPNTTGPFEIVGVADDGEFGLTGWALGADVGWDREALWALATLGNGRFSRPNIVATLTARLDEAFEGHPQVALATWGLDTGKAYLDLVQQPRDESVQWAAERLGALSELPETN